MQPNQKRQVDPQKRHMTLLIIWGAILMNVIMLFALANIVAPDPATLKEDKFLTIALTALGTAMMVSSYLFRQKMLARAIEQQRPESVSSAYIVAFAMSEVAALCGLLLRLLNNDRYYYLLFVIAVIGLVLNMPKRNDVVNASGQNSGMRSQ